jgi:CDP-diacylglycerol--serine O-phosphatidyltransferase
VSRLPVFSGKRVGQRVPPEMLLPVFVVIVLFFALLISYPWEVLTIGTLCYLAALPFGWMSYRNYERKAAAVDAPVPQPHTAASAVEPGAPAVDAPQGADDIRPTTRH